MPISPAEPLVRRILRVVARVVLASLVTFLASLVFLSMSSLAQKEVGAMLGFGDSDLARSKLLILVGIVPMVVFIMLIKLGQWLSWRALALGCAVMAPVLLYLAWDDAALHRPQTIGEFSPSFPGAEESYRVLMRYGKQQPGNQNFHASQLRWVGYDPAKPEPWRKFLAEHGEEIEKEWQALAPVWAWWNELNAFPRIGDLMPPRPDADILAFQPVRELSQRACAVATLRAQAGRGDEAMEILLPLIEVSRKIQPSSRSLVNLMITIVIEKMAMQTAGLVLDLTPVSPAVRARLAAVLAAPGGGETGVRRLIATDFVISQDTYGRLSLGEIIYANTKSPSERAALGILSPFVYNRRATLNLYADLTTDEEELAGRRQLEQLESRQKRFLEQDARPRFKNYLGLVLLNQMIPFTNKVVAAFWKTQDERAALLARVRAP